MNNALIGFSGFVGNSLLKQKSFEALYRSINIGDIHGHAFDTVVCAGARAQKWIANQKPEEDLRNIKDLITHLEQLTCKTFILISTVDVFKNPNDVDEKTRIEESGLHSYGLHRRVLEKFVEAHFKNHLIVRLPGLVGPGLRKNIIFDFLNENNLPAIDSRGVFQFYPMINLWYDIQTALNANLSLVHLTAEPISVTDVAEKGFGKKFTQAVTNTPAKYDMRTQYASLFGGHGHYQYSSRETIQAIRAYAQSEPCVINSNSSIES
jgi:dTDP-4-dehydrorhamnose reductase